MRNPLRTEAEAFRFLVAVIIAALVIAGAAYLNTWLGVAAAVLAVAASSGGSSRTPQRARPSRRRS